MNPKKAKTLLKDLDKELDLDKNLVYDILDFYWAHVRKVLTGAHYPRINVENLGTFQVKYKALIKTIDKYQFAINKLGTENFHKYARYHTMKSRLDVLLNIQKELEKESQRRKKIKLTRYDNTIGSLEEKREDS